MKAILLVGGNGTRLRPLTRVVNKHLLPVHDKPMAYYALSGLMLSGIREVLIISGPRDISAFEGLFGDGAQLGMCFEYAAQKEPRGVADALLLGRDFLQGDSVALALGDNLFYGQSLSPKLKSAAALQKGARIFACEVHDPERFGVVEFDENGRVLSLQEKPSEPRSNFAVGGLYFYDSSAPERAASLAPSQRGELEITDLNQSYLDQGLLSCERLGRGYLWADLGTPEALLKTSNLIEALESAQGFKIACLEEIAYRQGWIDSAQLQASARAHTDTAYGAYLQRLRPEN